MASPGLGRLRKGLEFDGVYREGTVLNGPLFVLRARANQLDRDRWGFAVGKKLAPQAVERNLVRRRLREGARQVELERRTGGANAWSDFVVTAKAPCLNASLPSMTVELARLCERAGTGPQK